MQPNEAAIEIQDLCKTYVDKRKLKNVPALKNVSLSIPKGSIFGLLGPNGAGKSTLINILGGIVIKSSGTAKIWGLSIDDSAEKARMNIGIVPQELAIDPFFNPLETLIIQAGLFGVKIDKVQSMDILRAVGLEEKATANARDLSGGMQRRLMVAKALVHNPPVVVLDEPTAGVDVNLRQQLWDYVQELNKKGTTVLLTTHYLEEAQTLCDQIAIIDDGELITNKPKKELLRDFDRKELIIKLEEPIEQAPASTDGFKIEQLTERKIKVTYHPSKHQFGEVLTYIQNLNVNVLDLETKEAGLEDVFMELTNSEQK